MLSFFKTSTLGIKDEGSVFGELEVFPSFSSFRDSLLNLITGCFWMFLDVVYRWPAVSPGFRSNSSSPDLFPSKRSPRSPLTAILTSWERHGACFSNSLVLNRDVWKISQAYLEVWILSNFWALKHGGFKVCIVYKSGFGVCRP